MNLLKEPMISTIQTLAAQGWSERRIARELKLNRKTVRRYAKYTTPSAGSGAVEGAETAEGSGESLEVEVSKYTTLSPGSVAASASDPETIVNAALAAAKASISLCEPWKDVIVAALEQQLSAKRIHQDLVRDHGFVGAYQSVKRYVRKLERAAPVPYRRMEFAPGEQMQVDFGLGAWIRQEDGRRRRPHVFRAVMCFSGKGYSEVVWNQKTETFLRCLENAFRYMGGVPATVAPDNLKAAVLHPDWFDPELNPKLAAFAEHYGTVILPTKPATPRHKGRVERGVDFVQENALKGRSFESLAAENTFLLDWERNVADTRIHGTTRQQVGKHFLEVEKAALRPLPASLFPSFTEGKRKVHLDGHVEFDRSFYSVPPEYLGRELWVRGESRLVRIYTLKMEPVTVHARAESGRSATDDAHIHPLKRRIADRGVNYMLSRCEEIGPCAGAWALAMHKHRGIESVRVLQGLLSLARANPHGRLEVAAGKALERAGWRLSDVRSALAEPENVVQVDFLETHPLIREMAAYRIPLPP